MKPLLLILLATLAVGCTEQKRAKSYGGTATIDLPSNRKLVTATWKEADLWLLTKPMTGNDAAERYEFVEESNWGILEGTVVIQESKVVAEATP